MFGNTSFSLRHGCSHTDFRAWLVCVEELLELMLAETDGISLTQQLRQHTLCPIIAVTSFPKCLFQAKALAAGCNDFMEKPIVVEDLETKIAHFIHNSFSFFLPSE